MLSMQWAHAWAVLAVVTAVVATAVPAGGAGDEGGRAYPVVVNRKRRVGESFLLSSSADVKQVATATPFGGRADVSGYHWRVEFEGRCQVRAVTATGQPKALACTVDRCARVTADGREGPEELLARGTQFVVNRGEEGVATFTRADGAEFDPPPGLLLALPVNSERQARLYTVWEPNGPRRVGEAWRLGAAAVRRIAEAESHEGAAIRPEEVDAEARLAGVEAVDGRDCLKVELRLKITHAGAAPTGGEIDDDPTEQQLTRVILGPVDPAQPAVASTDLMKQVATHRGQMPGRPGRGEELTLRRETDIRLEARYRPAP